MSDLKPCPFCESTESDFFLHKDNCYLRQRSKEAFDRKYDPVELYNTRPIEDALRAQAESHRLMYEAVLHAQAVLTNGKDVYPNNPYIDEALSELADALSLYNTGKYPTEGE